MRTAEHVTLLCGGGHESYKPMAVITGRCHGMLCRFSPPVTPCLSETGPMLMTS